MKYTAKKFAATFLKEFRREMLYAFLALETLVLAFILCFFMEH